MTLMREKENGEYALTWQGAELVAGWYKVLLNAGLTPLDTPESYRIAAAYLEAHNLFPELTDVEEEFHPEHAAVLLTFAHAVFEEGR